MQEQSNPDDAERPLDEEEPLSSEAPDALQPDVQNLVIPVEPEPLSPDPELAQTEDEIAAQPVVPGPIEALAEEPDGLVTTEAEDLLADANAVDPKIDVGLLEAYLFSTHSPLTPGRLAELFNLESTKPIRKALRLLNEQYEQTGRCFRVEQVAGGFQLLTLPDFGDHLKALHQREADAKLTKAALETLAIIAYKQPILRADLEAIRGVASGETIRSLMEKHLVKIAGRAEEPGRPILYGTTKRFLEIFGLNTLKDLPQPDSPQAKAQQLALAARSLLAEPEAASVQQFDNPAQSPAETVPREVVEMPAPQSPTTEPAPPEAEIADEAEAPEPPVEDPAKREILGPDSTPD